MENPPKISKYALKLNSNISGTIFLDLYRIFDPFALISILLYLICNFYPFRPF